MPVKKPLCRIAARDHRMAPGSARTSRIVCFDTHRTARVVADKLREFGVDDITTGIGRTGVVGVIKGRTDTSGKVIGLRADMDALPIHEQTGLDYASKTPNAMHACGHDGHTAMLLGAAKYLAETRNFDGTVVVILQPAEEGGGGGKVMCDDGLMERWNIQEVYGMHNWPGKPVGQFRDPARALLRRRRRIRESWSRARAAHAAKPQETVDSTLVASASGHIALQSIRVAQCRPGAAMRRLGHLVRNLVQGA